MSDFNLNFSFGDEELFPAVDLTSGMTDLSGNPKTVSPKDIMAYDFSAPPSGVLSTFSTPYTPFDDSPGFSNVSTDTSPIFGSGDVDINNMDSKNWTSLFPSEGDPFAPVADVDAPATSTVAQNQNPIEASPMMRDLSSASASPMVRSGSSPDSINGRSGRHSSSAGVKPRRRERPLKVLEFDTSDPVASKRARNTAAARKSRAKKVQRQEDLEMTIAGLEATIDEQASEIERLRALLSLAG